MIESFKRPPGSLRWPPRQRFSLSPTGSEARQRWEHVIAAARTADGGREGLESAERGWCGPLGVEPGDGIYLVELAAGPRTAAQLAESLADCGGTKAEAQAAVDRLFKAGLIVPESRTPAEP